MTDEQFTTKRLGLGYYQVTLKGTSGFVFNVIEKCKLDGIELFEDLPISFDPCPLDMQRTSDMLWIDQGMRYFNEFAFVAHEDTVALLKMKF